MVIRRRIGVHGSSVVVRRLVAAVQVRRFSRINGVRVIGFAHKVVHGNAPLAGVALFVALGGAYLAASRDLWWLVGVAATGGALLYVLSGRRWLRSYRKAPARLGPSRGRRRTRVLLFVVAALLAGAVVFLASSR